MKILFTISAILTSIVLHAQEGDVKVIKDNRIDALVAKQSEVIPPAINVEIDGYRVQVLFDSDKSTITSARAKLIAQFPKVDTYVEFNAPNFILKLGDFRTRLEAEKIKAEIENDFPTSFVIKEKINIPRLEKEFKD
jgi:HSP90 family molecular chaperone